MDAQQIKVFIDAMAASDLNEMEVEHEGWTLRLARKTTGALREAPSASVHAAPAEEAAATPAEPIRTTPTKSSGEVPAPMFGVVHMQQAPGEPPFVKVGDVVEAGQMLCSIEAMKMFNEVRAERGGRVTAIHAHSGSEVEAGQALFTIDEVAHV